MQFKNFFYEFNSFIELNEFGGYINMDQVTFEKFETCGSIVRNKKVRWYYDGKSASSAWSTNNTYSFVNNKAQYDFYSY